MRHRKRTVGLREDLSRGRAMDAFVQIRGADAVPQRQREIDALPALTWRGRLLRTIRCLGGFGNGPHDVNVPESLLWSLISVRGFRCAYHR